MKADRSFKGKLDRDQREIYHVVNTSFFFFFFVPCMMLRADVKGSETLVKLRDFS